MLGQRRCGRQNTGMAGRIIERAMEQIRSYKDVKTKQGAGFDTMLGQE